VITDEIAELTLEDKAIETLGFIFGMVGMSLGAAGFIFAVVCLGKLNKITAALKEKGVLDAQDKNV